MNLNFKNKLINGDSLEELKKIPDETFDLIFADPPYNLQLKSKLTRPDRSKVNAVNDKWDQFETRFTNAHETLIWASKSEKSKYTFNYQSLKCLNDDLQMRSNWELPICNGSERLKKNGKKVHSTQKPEALLHRILLATTNKNDLILDPFLGSGTTATVAKKLGRNYYGIEKEKTYFKAAEQRLRKAKPIEDDNLDTLQNGRSKPRIPFGSLVELGIIKPGTTIFDDKKKISAKIRADGSIKHAQTEGSIHKVAATILGAESCNGWTYWHYNLNGNAVPIDYLRQRLISNS